jgi:hypothetical protein
MVTAHQGLSTGSIFSPPISVLKGTHTMLDAEHKTLTGENIHVSLCGQYLLYSPTAMTRSAHFPLPGGGVLLSYYPSSELYNTAKAYLVKVVNFYKFTGKTVTPT